MRTGNGDVAGCDQSNTTAKRRTVNQGQGRARKLVQCAEHGSKLVSVCDVFFFTEIRGAAHPVVRQTSSEKGWGIPELRAEIAGLE